MSKFIKVTDSESGVVSFYNASNVTCFRDGELWSGEFSVSIKETAEQIESQLLRGEFAMAAMNGIMSNPFIDDIGADGVAHDAYLFADAMLKERLK